MNASQPAARRHTVPALVTAAVAAWFVLATGTALAATGQPAAAQVTLTPQGTMKLTVVAARPATQVALTPEGTMKLTVVAQRTQSAPLLAAAVRDASRS